MSDINDAELADFSAKIKHFKEHTLTPEQVPLFDQILKITWSAISTEELLAEFDGSFEAKHATAIMSCTASGPADLIHCMVRGLVHGAHTPHP